MVIKIRRFSSGLTAVGLVLLLAACTTPGTPMGETEVRRGVVEEIRQVQLESNHHPGVGAVVGGATGVGVGSLIGSGTGRDVAMVWAPSAERWPATKCRKSTRHRFKVSR